MDRVETKPVVLITGASNGLGRALAVVYARHGHNLLLTGRDPKALQETVSMAQTERVSVYNLSQDLEASDAVKNIVAYIEAQRLEIVVLINNAGLGSHGNFAHLSNAELHALLTVNIQSLVLLTNAISSMMMKKKSGHIINIGSVYSYAAIPGQVLYSASKAFVKSFSIGLRLDMQAHGIKVSCVCPGSTTQTKFRSRIGLQIDGKRFSAPAILVAEKIYVAMQKSPLIFIPLWYNKLFVFFIQCVPIALMAKISAFIVYRIRKVKEISHE